jgi:peptide/nickel transport system permease protein
MVALAIGVPTGLVAGYFSGWVDRILSRIAEALMCFPYLLLAMAIIAALGPGLRNAMTAIGLIFAPRLFRLVRASVMEIRSSTFIEAAVTCGTSTRRILLRHILPNISSPLIVQLTVMLSAALLAEASLSYLGLGVSPPDSSWGLMLGRAFEYIRSAPLGTYWPGLAIALTTLSLNLIGDGLRDALGRERVNPPRSARKEGVVK